MAVKHSEKESPVDRSAVYSCLQNQSSAPTIMVLTIYRKGLQAGKNRAGSVNNKNRANGKTYGNYIFFNSSFNRSSKIFI